MVDARDALLNDGPLVQVRRDKVRRGANDLHPALVRLVVRLGALEGRQEAVVDVDDAARHGLAERRREHLHVAREHDELDAVLPHEVEHPRLLLRLGVLCDGEVVELDAVRGGEGLVVGVVGDDDGDLAGVLLVVLFSSCLSILFCL